MSVKDFLKSYNFSESEASEPCFRLFLLVDTVKQLHEYTSWALGTFYGNVCDNPTANDLGDPWLKIVRVPLHCVWLVSTGAPIREVIDRANQLKRVLANLLVTQNGLAIQSNETSKSLNLIAVQTCLCKQSQLADGRVVREVVGLTLFGVLVVIVVDIDTIDFEDKVLSLVMLVPPDAKLLSKVLKHERQLFHQVTGVVATEDSDCFLSKLDCGNFAAGIVGRHHV